MKKCLLKFKKMTMVMMVMCASSTVFAGLPKPPDNEMASSSKGWVDVLGFQSLKILNLGCMLLGVILLISVVANILKAYHTAHEKGDLGHFFKILLVGLLVLTIGMGLLYFAAQIKL